MLSSLAPLALSAMSFAPADDCDGDPGFVLTVTPPVAQLGEQVNIKLEGPSNQPAFLMVSTGEGPVDTSYGKICLDFPLLFSRFVVLNDLGISEFNPRIPLNCNLDDLTVFMQFIVCDPFKAASNQASLHLDAPALGDLVYGDCVDEDLQGLSAREVLEIAELIISGAFGQCDGEGSCKDEDVFDASGDGTPDVSLIDVHEALDLLNNSFGDCTNDGTSCFGNAAGCNYCTYTPGGYSQDCRGNNVGCLRDAWFDSLFPQGLLIGDPDGDDDDSEFSVLLTSSEAMRILVGNSTGTPATLNADAVDPAHTSAGRFTAHVLAAKFNIALSDAGVTGN